MPDNKGLLSEKERRRLRINRLKKALIITLVVSIVIPIITCIILCIKVAHLESDVKELMAMSKGNNTSLVDDDINKESEEDFETSSSESVEITAQDETDETTTQETTTPVAQENTKQVYLTFDDGPSSNTQAILDVLARYGVKATFFVVGRTDETSMALYKQIVDSGNTIGMHSYSHRYNTVYESVTGFAQDVEQISSLITEATGVTPKLYRFPGGSSNTVSEVPMTEFIKYLNEQQITYFDWNVSSQDAVSNNVSVDDIYNNVINGVSANDKSVVLLHDTEYKNTTVEALSRIIEELQRQGVQILPLSETVEPVQHIKATDVQ